MRKLSLRTRRMQRRRTGQGMTEYIVLVGLIAILLIAAVTQFKNALGNAFNNAASKVDSDITNKIQSG